MPDPTIKDVLAALEKLSAKIDTKADAAEMRKGAAEMRQGFARVEKQIADLDTDLDGHM